MKFVAKGWLQRPGRLVLSTLLAFSALLLGALPAAAQTDVTGVWVVGLPTGDGNIIKTFFDLKQSGEQVTGAVWYDYGERPIREGSFRDGKLHLVFVLWQADPLPLGYLRWHGPGR